MNPKLAGLLKEIEQFGSENDQVMTYKAKRMRNVTHLIDSAGEEGMNMLVEKFLAFLGVEKQEPNLNF